MDEKKPVIGFTGIALGAIALLMALIHFWAGPFSPQPKLEDVVAEKAVAIRDATIAALKGESKTVKPQPVTPSYDLDRILDISTAVLGALAVILGVIAIAMKEPMRVGGGAAVLGIGAIGFQFAALALGVLVLVILISAVLGDIGIG